MPSSRIPDLVLHITAENGKLKASLRGAKGAVGDFEKEVGKDSKHVNRNINSIDRNLEEMRNSMESVKALGAVFLSFEAIKEGIKAITEANIEILRVKFSLYAALGSAKAANTEFNYLFKTSQRLGASFEDLAGSYAVMTASAKAAGVKLGQSRELFEQLNKAAVTFHLTTYQMRSAMLGLEQAFAQGQFRIEELRRQIGQQLPGFFENFQHIIEAEGKNFRKLLATGGLTVKEYVDEITQALKMSYDPEAFTEASKAINAVINRTKNEILLFKAAMGSGLIEQAEIRTLKAFSAVLQSIANSPALKGIQIALLVGIFGALAKGASLAITKLRGMVTAGVASVQQNNKAGASYARLQSAIARSTVAKERQVQATRAVVAAQTELIQARRANLRAATEETAASLRGAEAKLAEARAARTGAAAELESAAAFRTRAASVATARRATTRLGVAVGGLATAGRGLVSILGGLPGIILAVVSALVLFVDWTSDAEEAADKLAKATKKLKKDTEDVTAALINAAETRAKLAKLKASGASPEVIANEAGKLRYQAKQATLGLKELRQVSLAQATEEQTIARQIKKKTEQLKKAKEAYSDAYNAKRTFFGANKAEHKDLVQASIDVSSLSDDLEDLKDKYKKSRQQHALTLKTINSKLAKKNVASTAAKDLEQSSSFDLTKLLHHFDLYTDSLRKKELGARTTVQKLQDDTINGLRDYFKKYSALSKEDFEKQYEVIAKAKYDSFAAKKKALVKFALSTTKLTQEQSSDLLARVDASYTKALAIAKKIEKNKKDTPDPTSGAAANVHDLEQANKGLTSTYVKMRGAIDPVFKAWNDYFTIVNRATAQANLLKSQEGANVGQINKELGYIKGAARENLLGDFAAMANKAKEKWEDLLATLRTPAEVQTAKLRDQLAAIEAAFVGVNGKVREYKALVNKAVGQSVSDMPKYNGPDAVVGGAFGELLKSGQALQDLQQWHEEKLAANDLFRSKDLDHAAAYARQKALIEQGYQKEVTRIHGAQARIALKMADEKFGMLARSMASAYGEQSRQAKLAFALQKAAAIAQTILAINVAISKAMAATGPFGMAAGIAAAVAEGASLLGTIRGTSLQAPSGYKGGGPIKGQGTGTSDSILARVSDGEFIVKNRAVKHFGLSFMNKVNNLQLPTYAAGGSVDVSSFGAAPVRAGLSARDGAAKSAGNIIVAPVNVIIHSQGGAEPEVEQSTSSDGARSVELWLSGMMAQDVSNNGSLSQAIENKWVLQRRSYSYG